MAWTQADRVDALTPRVGRGQEDTECADIAFLGRFRGTARLRIRMMCGLIFRLRHRMKTTMKQNQAAACARTAPVRASGAMRTLLGLFLLPLASAQGAGPEEPRQVMSLLRQAGYQEVRDIEFDDGLWEAEVRRSHGRWEEISVDPVTGEIFDLRGQRKVMPMRQLLDTLERQGYRDFTDIDRDAGVWNIEATDRQGRRVELKVSGHDGRVLHSRFDD